MEAEKAGGRWREHQPPAMLMPASPPRRGAGKYHGGGVEGAQRGPGNYCGLVISLQRGSSPAPDLCFFNR